jgi:hypothetical protein
MINANNKRKKENHWKKTFYTKKNPLSYIKFRNLFFNTWLLNEWKILSPSPHYSSSKWTLFVLKFHFHLHFYYSHSLHTLILELFYAIGIQVNNENHRKTKRERTKLFLLLYKSGIKMIIVKYLIKKRRWWWWK